ncbi:MAG: hypothetical protein ACK5PP_10035, partial [Acidimicrobiales bacterium]
PRGPRPPGPFRGDVTVAADHPAGRLDVGAIDSMANTLSELSTRMAATLGQADPDHDAMMELREIERQLQNLVRRLTKTTRRLR